MFCRANQSRSTRARRCRPPHRPTPTRRRSAAAPVRVSRGAARPAATPRRSSAQRAGRHRVLGENLREHRVRLRALRLTLGREQGVAVGPGSLGRRAHRPERRRRGWDLSLLLRRRPRRERRVPLRRLERLFSSGGARASSPDGRRRLSRLHRQRARVREPVCSPPSTSAVVEVRAGSRRAGSRRLAPVHVVDGSLGDDLELWRLQSHLPGWRARAASATSVADATE